jgi:hypothetical protein
MMEHSSGIRFRGFSSSIIIITELMFFFFFLFSCSRYQRLGWLYQGLAEQSRLNGRYYIDLALSINFYKFAFQSRTKIGLAEWNLSENSKPPFWYKKTRRMYCAFKTIMDDILKQSGITNGYTVHCFRRGNEYYSTRRSNSS